MARDITVKAEIEVNIGEETFYPTIEVTTTYTPGWKGDRIDPPEGAEVNYVSATLVSSDGCAINPGDVLRWACMFIDSDDGYNAICAAADDADDEAFADAREHSDFCRDAYGDMD